MAGISRRDFIGRAGGASAALAFMAANGMTLDASPLGIPIGSQTYPHRARIAAGEFAALLKDMKAIGIEQVELCDPFNYADFKSLADGKTAKKMLDDAGIKAVSAHVGMRIYRQQFADVIRWAHDVGLTQLNTADLGGRVVNGWTTDDEIKRAADEYSKIAQNTKKEGFNQALHNEGFANSRTPDGRLTYPLLIQALDPLVGMQFQMSSMPTVGDPIAYFNLFPGRFVSAHLQGVDTTQGMRASRAGFPTPKPTPEQLAAQQAGRGRGAGGRAGGQGGGGLAVGEDNVDWPKVFEAAKAGGLKNYFVEQAWDLTVRSVAYLKTLS